MATVIQEMSEDVSPQTPAARAIPVTVNPSQIADARFLKQEELGEDGTVTGVMMQFIERYRELDGTSAVVTGRILDIGEYLNVEVGEQVYEALRETVIEGDLTTHELEWLAEELAQDNDLPGNAWRELSAADIGRYQVAIAEDRREQTLDLDMESAEMTGAAWSRDID